MHLQQKGEKKVTFVRVTFWVLAGSWALSQPCFPRCLDTCLSTQGLPVAAGYLTLSWRQNPLKACPTLQGRTAVTPQWTAISEAVRQPDTNPLCFLPSSFALASLTRLRFLVWKNSSCQGSKSCVLHPFLYMCFLQPKHFKLCHLRKTCYKKPRQWDSCVERCGHRSGGSLLWEDRDGDRLACWAHIPTEGRTEESTFTEWAGVALGRQAGVCQQTPAVTVPLWKHVLK